MCRLRCSAPWHTRRVNARLTCAGITLTVLTLTVAVFDWNSIKLQDMQLKKLAGGHMYSNVFYLDCATRLGWNSEMCFYDIWYSARGYFPSLRLKVFVTSYFTPDQDVAVALCRFAVEICSTITISDTFPLVHQGTRAKRHRQHLTPTSVKAHYSSPNAYSPWFPSLFGNLTESVRDSTRVI